MSEQQSGAAYPQQPTSGQPQQQAYPQAPYASPQAQYQAQQQYAAYAPPAPSLFDKLGVPSMPAILGLSGLGALALAGLIAGTSSGGSDFAGLDGTTLSGFVRDELNGGVLSILVGVIVMFALTLFTGERLRPLWKVLTIAGGTIFLARLLFTMLALGDGNSASDASAWIGALLLVAAYGLFVAGALMVPGSASAQQAPPAAGQGYPTGQQPAVQPQNPQAPPANQQNQWPQAPQQ
ncbi:hypothetical protein K3N28_16815 [Glycomyces sp. TRM65418]|uniref:hypothetical protein n=1 Tax=Glycomyces sp. TRM65418 TaxID=2867006 RepID=UPI001CE6503E|nr:hypothetical protein [Glycomyces sp. TRM65418]MCC3764721.1 hypothetical protein [Glycomyces sp. TRM65418]QZD54379.1 hypothetical protein K3N28_16730 [Glycomyces sp. TRM65418]